MSVRIRDGSGTLRTATRIRIRDAGNALRTVQRIRVRDSGNVLRTVYSALSASISNANPSGSGTGADITTSSTTVSAVGGIGPFTFAWTRGGFSGSSNPVPNNAAAATTAFAFNGVTSGETAFAFFFCTVTDTATGATADASCRAAVTNTGPNI